MISNCKGHDHFSNITHILIEKCIERIKVIYLRGTHPYLKRKQIVIFLILPHKGVSILYLPIKEAYVQFGLMLQPYIQHKGSLWNDLKCCVFSWRLATALTGGHNGVTCHILGLGAHSAAGMFFPRFRPVKCALCNTEAPFLLQSKLLMSRVVQGSLQVGLRGFPQGENVFSASPRGRRSTANSTKHQ